MRKGKRLVSLGLSVAMLSNLFLTGFTNINPDLDNYSKEKDSVNLTAKDTRKPHVETNVIKNSYFEIYADLKFSDRVRDIILKESNVTNPPERIASDYFFNGKYKDEMGLFIKGSVLNIQDGTPGVVDRLKDIPLYLNNGEGTYPVLSRDAQGLKELSNEYVLLNPTTNFTGDYQVKVFAEIVETNPDGYAAVILNPYQAYNSGDMTDRVLFVNTFGEKWLNSGMYKDRSLIKDDSTITSEILMLESFKPIGKEYADKFQLVAFKYKGKNSGLNTSAILNRAKQNSVRYVDIYLGSGIFNELDILKEEVVGQNMNITFRIPNFKRYSDSGFNQFRVYVKSEGITSGVNQTTINAQMKEVQTISVPLSFFGDSYYINLKGEMKDTSKSYPSLDSQLRTLGVDTSKFFCEPLYRGMQDAKYYEVVKKGIAWKLQENKYLVSGADSALENTPLKPPRLGRMLNRVYWKENNETKGFELGIFPDSDMFPRTLAEYIKYSNPMVLVDKTGSIRTNFKSVDGSVIPGLEINGHLNISEVLFMSKAIYYQKPGSRDSDLLPADYTKTFDKSDDTITYSDHKRIQSNGVDSIAKITSSEEGLDDTVPTTTNFHFTADGQYYVADIVTGLKTVKTSRKYQITFPSVRAKTTPDVTIEPYGADFDNLPIYEILNKVGFYFLNFEKGMNLGYIERTQSLDEEIFKGYNFYGYLRTFLDKTGKFSYAFNRKTSHHQGVNKLIRTTTLARGDKYYKENGLDFLLNEGILNKWIKDPISKQILEAGDRTLSANRRVIVLPKDAYKTLLRGQKTYDVPLGAWVVLAMPKLERRDHPEDNYITFGKPFSVERINTPKLLDTASTQFSILERDDGRSLHSFKRVTDPSITGYEDNWDIVVFKPTTREVFPSKIQYTFPKIYTNEDLWSLHIDSAYGIKEKTENIESASGSYGGECGTKTCSGSDIKHRSGQGYTEGKTSLVKRFYDWGVSKMREDGTVLRNINFRILEDNLLHTSDSYRIERIKRVGGVKQDRWRLVDVREKYEEYKNHDLGISAGWNETHVSTHQYEKGKRTVTGTPSCTLVGAVDCTGKKPEDKCVPKAGTWTGSGLTCGKDTTTTTTTTTWWGNEHAVSVPNDAKVVSPFGAIKDKSNPNKQYFNFFDAMRYRDNYKDYSSYLVFGEDISSKGFIHDIYKNVRKKYDEIYKNNSDGMTVYSNEEVHEGDARTKRGIIHGAKVNHSGSEKLIVFMNLQPAIADPVVRMELILDTEYIHNKELNENKAFETTEVSKVRFHSYPANYTNPISKEVFTDFYTGRYGIDRRETGLKGPVYRYTYSIFADKNNALISAVKNNYWLDDKDNPFIYKDANKPKDRNTLNLGISDDLFLTYDRKLVDKQLKNNVYNPWGNFPMPESIDLLQGAVNPATTVFWEIPIEVKIPYIREAKVFQLEGAELVSGMDGVLSKPLTMTNKILVAQYNGSSGTEPSITDFGANSLRRLRIWSNISEETKSPSYNNVSQSPINLTAAGHIRWSTNPAEGESVTWINPTIQDLHMQKGNSYFIDKRDKSKISTTLSIEPTSFSLNDDFYSTDVFRMFRRYFNNGITGNLPLGSIGISLPSKGTTGMSLPNNTNNVYSNTPSLYNYINRPDFRIESFVDDAYKLRGIEYNPEFRFIKAKLEEPTNFVAISDILAFKTPKGDDVPLYVELKSSTFKPIDILKSNKNSKRNRVIKVGAKRKQGSNYSWEIDPSYSDTVGIYDASTDIENNPYTTKTPYKKFERSVDSIFNISNLDKYRLYTNLLAGVLNIYYPQDVYVDTSDWPGVDNASMLQLSSFQRMDYSALGMHGIMLPRNDRAKMQSLEGSHYSEDRFNYERKSSINYASSGKIWLHGEAASNYNNIKPYSDEKINLAHQTIDGYSTTYMGAASSDPVAINMDTPLQTLLDIGVRESRSQTVVQMSPWYRTNKFKGSTGHLEVLVADAPKDVFISNTVSSGRSERSNFIRSVSHGRVYNDFLPLLSGIPNYDLFYTTDGIFHRYDYETSEAMGGASAPFLVQTPFKDGLSQPFLRAVSEGVIGTTFTGNSNYSDNVIINISLGYPTKTRMQVFQYWTANKVQDYTRGLFNIFNEQTIPFMEKIAFSDLDPRTRFGRNFSLRELQVLMANPEIGIGYSFVIREHYIENNGLDDLHKFENTKTADEIAKNGFESFDTLYRYNLLNNSADSFYFNYLNEAESNFGDYKKITKPNSYNIEYKHKNFEDLDLYHGSDFQTIGDSAKIPKSIMMREFEAPINDYIVNYVSGNVSILKGKSISKLLSLNVDTHSPAGLFLPVDSRAYKYKKDYGGDNQHDYYRKYLEANDRNRTSLGTTGVNIANNLTKDIGNSKIARMRDIYSTRDFITKPNGTYSPGNAYLIYQPALWYVLDDRLDKSVKDKRPNYNGGTYRLSGYKNVLFRKFKVKASDSASKKLMSTILSEVDPYDMVIHFISEATKNAGNFRVSRSGAVRTTLTQNTDGPYVLKYRIPVNDIHILNPVSVNESTYEPQHRAYVPPRIEHAQPFSVVRDDAGGNGISASNPYVVVNSRHNLNSFPAGYKEGHLKLSTLMTYLTLPVDVIAFNNYYKAGSRILANEIDGGSMTFAISPNAPERNNVSFRIASIPINGLNSWDKANEGTVSAKEDSSLKRHEAYNNIPVDVTGSIGGLEMVGSTDKYFTDYFKDKVLSEYRTVNGFNKDHIVDGKKHNTYNQTAFKEKLLDLDLPLAQKDDTTSTGRLPAVGSRQFYDITTVGDIHKVKVIPKYYLIDRRTNEIIPADVWQPNPDGGFYCINAPDRELRQNPPEVKKTRILLNWEDERKTRHMEGLPDVNGRIPVDKHYPNTESYATYYNMPNVNELDQTSARGTVDIGSHQELILTNKVRTNVGSSTQYDLDKKDFALSNSDHTGNKEPHSDKSFYNMVNRWHFSVGLPSDSIVVPHYVRPDKGNNKIFTSYKNPTNPEPYDPQVAEDNKTYLIIETLVFEAYGKDWKLLHANDGKYRIKNQPPLEPGKPVPPVVEIPFTPPPRPGVPPNPPGPPGIPTVIYYPELRVSNYDRGIGTH